MTEPKASVEHKTVTYTDKATRVYKQELTIVVISTLMVMVIAMGVFFMQPFPQLLNVTVWGFPFPYWYQLTLNWVGPILLGYYVCNLLAKNDAEKERVGKEDK
jgi:uncharacterized membrane protein